MITKVSQQRRMTSLWSRRRLLAGIAVMGLLGLSAGAWTSAQAAGIPAIVPTKPAVTPAAAAQTVQGDTKSEKERARIPQPRAGVVALNATAVLKSGARVRIEKMEAVQGEATGPGEVAGPALRFQVTVDNPTSVALPTANPVLALAYGAALTPGLQLGGPGATRLPDAVNAHGSASAVYVFNVAADQREKVLILVNFGVAEDVLAFEGAAPKAGK
ncbi:hypothetical protein [Arthrobacter sp. UYEF3]|uniref:hypothetical protein n=1 Tax=Arthrobacter sp. UYEF3 TaxID=1756365 RepID=UPI003390904D